MSDILMIIAPANFRDEELFETKEALEERGHHVTLASSHTGICTGSLGKTARAEIPLEEVSSEMYDAFIFVGGNGCSVFFDDRAALSLARNAYEDDKIIAAICLAPIILAKADILGGKRATVTPARIKLLEKLGATFAGVGVVTDGNIVTADGPQSARRFGETITAMLENGSPEK